MATVYAVLRADGANEAAEVVRERFVRYGTGHGKDGQHRGLQPKHARLAVAAAVALIDFVSETHRYREASEPQR